MKPYAIVLIVIVIIGIGVGGYYLFSKNKKNSEFETKPLDQNNTAKNEPKNENVSFTEEYVNSDHNLSFKYPKGWKSKDLGGEKNVKDSLVKENVIYVYEPAGGQDDKVVNANLKLLRFVIESDAKIKSEDDWYNYVKSKVDKFMGEKALVSEVGYNLLSLEKVNEINGHPVVREDYTLKDNVRGRDYYVYADDIYQFVFECRASEFDKYQDILLNIVNSFNIK